MENIKETNEMNEINIEANSTELNMEDMEEVAGGAKKKIRKTKKKLPEEVFSGTQEEYLIWTNLEDFELD